MPRRDTRMIGRKLGGALRGIFGGLAGGGDATVNPEVANLMQYGEYGNVAGDASMPIFKPAGANFLGQSSQMANQLNNNVFMQQLLGQSNLANSKELASHNANLTTEANLERLRREEELKQQQQTAELERQGEAIRLAIASTGDPKVQQMFELNGPYNNASYARFAGAKFGDRLKSEGTAGIPSALATQEAEAATKPWLPLGEGRYNPITEQYAEGGRFISNEIPYTDAFGLPQTRKTTTRINPTRMTMPVATQAELDMFKAPMGGMGQDINAPFSSAINPNGGGNNIVKPADSGIAPPPKTQYVGLIPSAVEGAKTVGSKLGGVAASVPSNIKALAPEISPELSGAFSGVNNFGSDIGKALIRRADEPAPQFKENLLDIYLNDIIRGGVAGGLDTMASPVRDIGTGLGAYTNELFNQYYDPSKPLPFPKGSQPPINEYYDPNNMSLTYPNNMPEHRRKSRRGIKLRGQPNQQY